MSARRKLICSANVVVKVAKPKTMVRITKKYRWIELHYMLKVFT